MTITKLHKEYENKETHEIFFVEMYANKPHFIWFWRYGYIDRNGLAVTLKDMLFSKPNLKRLGLICQYYRHYRISQKLQIIEPIKYHRIMAKNGIKYTLMSYNRYTERFDKMNSFRTLKAAKQWMWDEELDWLHLGYVVQDSTATSLRMQDNMGNIAAYRIERDAA